MNLTAMDVLFSTMSILGISILMIVIVLSTRPRR